MAFAWYSLLFHFNLSWLRHHRPHGELAAPPLPVLLSPLVSRPTVPQVSKKIISSRRHRILTRDPCPSLLSCEAVVGGYCQSATTLAGSSATTDFGSADICVGMVNSTTGEVSYFQSYGASTSDAVYGVAIDSLGGGYFGGKPVPLRHQNGASVSWQAISKLQCGLEIRCISSEQYEHC